MAGLLGAAALRHARLAGGDAAEKESGRGGWWERTRNVEARSVTSRSPGGPGPGMLQIAATRLA